MGSSLVTRTGVAAGREERSGVTSSPEAAWMAARVDSNRKRRPSHASASLGSWALLSFGRIGSTRAPILVSSRILIGIVYPGVSDTKRYPSNRWLSGLARHVLG